VEIHHSVREAPHARPVQSCVELEPEVEPRRRLRDRELGLDFLRYREIALAAELERLQLDLDRVAMLLPRPEAEAAERKAGQRPS
jgi:hypothetical protein